ncbi:MAG: hypothetical protein WC455_18640 [Dehalococcoidia bacterium]|jgi:hypothetical protein
MSTESDYICRLQGRISQLELRTDVQAKQIETLKAALRQDRIERLLSDAGRFGIALDVGTAHQMAREQLAREMPEIFGKEEI